MLGMRYKRYVQEGRALIAEEQQKVYDILKELDIEYRVCRHAPLVGAEDRHVPGYHQPGLNVKNLVLKDKKTQEIYMVVLKDDARLDFKKYKEIAGWSKKISFADEEDLKKYLGVSRGSCSVFSLINDREKRVRVVISEYIAKAPENEKISFHPNDNTATVTISVKDMYRFLAWTGNDVIHEGR